MNRLPDMRKAVLILEDEQVRLERLKAALAGIDCGLTLYTWSNAHAMIRDMDQHLSAAALMSLDHDLYPDEEHAPDAGDGLDVAKKLADITPCCPIIIHSSNGDRANMMLGVLELAGWQCHRVPPIGDDWVESHWVAVVEQVVRDASKAP